MSVVVSNSQLKCFWCGLVFTKSLFVQPAKGSTQYLHRQSQIPSNRETESHGSAWADGRIAREEVIRFFACIGGESCWAGDVDATILA
jgi:hypothetical protein